MSPARHRLGFRGFQRSPRTLGLAALVGASMWPATSWAQPPAAPALRPTLQSEGAVTVESSEVLPSWTPSASLLTTIASDVGGAYNRAQPWQIDKRLDSHVLVAVGILGHAELGFDLPLILNQRGKVGLGQSTLVPTSFGDARASLKGTFFHLPTRGLGLGAVLDLYVPTGERKALASTGGYGFAAQILFEQRGRRGITNTANLGYIARKDTSAGRYALGDALTYRLASAVPFGPQLNFAVNGELDGSLGVVDKADAPLAFRVGVRWRMRSGMVLALYGGVNPVATLGSGDLHAMLRIGWTSPVRLANEPAFRGAPRRSARALVREYERSYAPPSTQEKVPHRPDDPDADTILAQLDACPNVAEDKDNFEDADGCPERDNDRDTLLDPLDLCPVLPEVVNGVGDWDGCPDVRTDHDQGKILTQLDWNEILPAIALDGLEPQLSASTRQALTRVAELLRLNPWIGPVDLRLVPKSGVAIPPPVDGKDPQQRANARLQQVRQLLIDAGVESWRVRAIAPGREANASAFRLRFEVRGFASGLRPLAPSPAILQEMLDNAQQAGRQAERLHQASIANPETHAGSPMPRLDTSAVGVPNQAAPSQPAPQPTPPRR